MIPNVKLEELPSEVLAERLVEMAQRARRLAADGDVVELGDMFASVRSAAERASGEALRLLDVTEAFFRALVRTDIGRTELALRRFALAQEDAGAAVLLPLADGESITREEVDALGPLGHALVEVGALREVAGNRLDLRPSLRSLARDLVEPAAFRLWRRVELARAAASLSRMSDPQAAALLAAELGATQPQATRHLRSYPITVTGGAPVIAPMEPRGFIYRQRHGEPEQREERGRPRSQPTGIFTGVSGQDETVPTQLTGLSAAGRLQEPPRWN